MSNKTSEIRIPPFLQKFLLFTTTGTDSNHIESRHGRIRFVLPITPFSNLSYHRRSFLSLICAPLRRLTSSLGTPTDPSLFLTPLSSTLGVLNELLTLHPHSLSLLGELRKRLGGRRRVEILYLSRYPEKRRGTCVRDLH